MNDNPINGLVEDSLRNIRQMVDVNTIVGDPIKTDEGTVIIPISKVSFGFASGGGEYASKNPSNVGSKPLFSGGAGAGITISPIAFLVVQKDEIKIIPMSTSGSGGPVEKLIDYIPYAFDKVSGIIKKDSSEQKTE